MLITVVVWLIVTVLAAPEVEAASVGVAVMSDAEVVASTSVEVGSASTDVVDAASTDEEASSVVTAVPCPFNAASIS